MIKVKLVRLCKDLTTDKNLAVFWLYYDNHPMKGDGELIILEEGQTHQDSREIKDDS